MFSWITAFIIVALILGELFRSDWEGIGAGIAVIVWLVWGVGKYCG